MKQLLLIRHAAAEWSGPDDFNRLLSLSGNAEAVKMARQLVSKEIIPDLLVSSSALRAISTAKLFADVFNKDYKNIRQEATMYEATVATLLKIINRFQDEHQLIALFGHNPGITNLLLKLTDGEIYDFPTCGISLIEFPLDSWKLISGGTGELLFFGQPD